MCERFKVWSGLGFRVLKALERLQGFGFWGVRFRARLGQLRGSTRRVPLTVLLL